MQRWKRYPARSADRHGARRGRPSYTRAAWLAAGLAVSPYVHAGPYGYDLHNVLMPASGAMAGTSLAQPQDVPSAVFGNPATMTQFKGTQFTFGVTFYDPSVKLRHDGTVTGAAFEGNSDTKVFPVPNVAVTQDLHGLGLPVVVGMGLTPVSGIGAHFRQIPESLGAGAEFIIFGVNAGAAVKVTDKLSVGGAATVSFAQLDAGLSSVAAETHAIGGRVSVGATYELPKSTHVGVFYQSKLSHNFNSLFQTGTTASGLPLYSDQEIEQPENIGIGISNSSLMGGKLLLAADFIYKRWEDAEFWQDVFEDQRVFSVGTQYTNGPWRYRAGYGHANDPNRSAPTKLGGLTQVVTGPGGIVIPLSTPVIQYLQATQTEVIYKHRYTFGVGYSGFLMPGLDVDGHVGFQKKESRDFGTHTVADVRSWHAGFGLTWRF